MKRLIITRENKLFLGVCGALGEYFRIDPTVIRIIFVLSTFIFIGSPIFLYIILYLMIPKKKYDNKRKKGKEDFYDFNEFDEK